MNYNDNYIPVAKSVGLGRNKLLRVYLNDMPVVLFRGSMDRVNAYEDKCPHRGAMLSEGRLVNNELECPYHGWRFNADGQNSFVPVRNAKADCRLAAVPVMEMFGLIWLATDAKATLPSLMPEKPRAMFSGHISAKPANVLENFLEGSHTHYVHNGWVRASNKKRQKIEAQLIPGDKGFEVQYQQEPAKGILTKLVPKSNRHLRAVSTYIYPFTAVLEYFNSENKSVFRVEMILSPSGNETSYYARVYLQIGVLSRLAVSLMKPLLANVIRQDKRILEQQEQNLSSGKSARFFSDDTDLVGKQIFSWLFDRERIARQPAAFTVWW